MPPKAAKKPDKKKIAKAIEDKTFGLKNKSKSKKVQGYVNSVVHNVKHTSGVIGSEEAKAKKKQAKEAAKQAEDELKLLFDTALLAGKKAPGAQGGKGSNVADPVAVDTKEKQVQETFEVAETERTIEDLIEEQRAKLHAEGKKGTPVNTETLAVWKAERAARKREEEKKLVEREIAKKGKKKGLGVLSGRALFDYDASLFRDDEDAATMDEVTRREEAQHDDDDNDVYHDANEQADALADTVEESLFIDADDVELDGLDEEPDTSAAAAAPAAAAAAGSSREQGHEESKGQA